MNNENWILCRKPLEEKTVADNVLKYGTGGINIDGSRIKTDDKLGRINNTKDNYSPTSFCMATNERVEYNLSDISGGRFPANFIYCGDDEVIEEFNKAGVSKSGKGSGLTSTKARSNFNNSIAGINRTGFQDEGTPSRFFFDTKE